MKGQAKDLEKIYSNHISGLFTIYFFKLSKFSKKKTKKPIKIWAKDMNIHYTKENTWMANKHIFQNLSNCILKHVGNRFQLYV